MTHRTVPIDSPIYLKKPSTTENVVEGFLIIQCKDNSIEKHDSVYGFIYYLKKDIIKRRFIEIKKLSGGLICSMTFLI